MRNINSIIIATIFLVVSYAQKNLTLGCKTCPKSTCSSGYCFSLTGSSFNETQCVPSGKTCKQGLNQTIQVNNCTVDYMSSACSRGICFYTLSASALLGFNCSTNYTEQIACGACQSNLGCGSNICQSIVRPPSSTAQIGCVNSCPNPPNTTYIVQACPNGFDQLGGQNNCCLTFRNTAGPVCITQNLYLASSSNLDNYVGGPKSTTKNMESVLKGIILFLIMFIAAMFL